MTVQEGNRNKEWALRSLLTLPMQGPKSPSVFVSALSGGFDAGEKSNYVSVMLRYPYGTLMRIACDRLGATVFSAAEDDDRLRYIGNNYQLRRYPFESGTSFETRCGTAWDLHGEGGTSIAVRKAYEAYGFPQIEILEECDHPLLTEGSDYGWAELIVFGPNYGEIPIDGCYLDTAILDGDNAHLGTGSFSKEQIDDVIRVLLDQRQVHDEPLALAFRFGEPAILDMCSLDSVILDGPDDGVEYAYIKLAHHLDVVHLDETTLDGFGV